MGFGSRAARLPIRYWLPLRMDGVCPTLSGLTLRHRPELLSNRLPRPSHLAHCAGSRRRSGRSLARLAIVSVCSAGLAFVMAAATPAANVLASFQDAFGRIGTTT
jgi:hypothetical protein